MASNTPSIPNRKRRIVWTVRPLMAQHGIRTVSDLARRLNAAGVEISISQLGRLIDGKNKLWNQEVMEGLMAMFDCELSDLVQSEPIQTHPGA